MLPTGFSDAYNTVWMRGKDSEKCNNIKVYIYQYIQLIISRRIQRERPPKTHGVVYTYILVHITNRMRTKSVIMRMYKMVYIRYSDEDKEIPSNQRFWLA